MTAKPSGAQNLLTEARALLKKDEEKKFFDTLFGGGGTDDIGRSSAAALAGLARMAWSEAEKHVPGGIEVALLPGSDVEDPESVVVAAQLDDRPFLFDSVLAAAIASGGRIRAAFHPVVPVKGKPASVIVLVLDAILGSEAQTALRNNLTASLILGRDAVRDWKAMLARLKQTRDGLAANPPKGVDIEEDLAFLDWLGDNYFTFLGARDYALHADGEAGRLDPVPGSGLGRAFPTPKRAWIRQTAERPALTREVREPFSNSPNP